MSDTVRSHLEWLQTNPWAQPEYIAAHAVAALALMDEAELVGHRRKEMFTHPEQHYDHEETVGDDRLACRLIPDPLKPGAGSSLPGAPTSEETT